MSAWPDARKLAQRIKASSYARVRDSDHLIQIIESARGEPVSAEERRAILEDLHRASDEAKGLPNR